MKHFKVLTIIISFVSTVIFSQAVPTASYERFYIEAGLQVPLGNLKSRINAAPNFGFWYKSRVRESEFVDFGFNTSFQNSTNNFIFEKNDSIFRSTPRGLSGMVGMRYCKSVKLSSKKNSFVDVFPSLGLAFMFLKSDLTGLKNGRNFNEHQKTMSLQTIHVGQGVRFNIDNVGVQAQYQFTPFAYFNKSLDKNFGSHSLIFGIVYRQ